MSDRDTDAFVLSAWAMVNASLCPAATSELDFPSFITKDLLCGSHIKDTDIHLSPEQKLKLDSPFIAGSYFGTGASSRTFELDFVPSLIIIIRDEMPLISADFREGTNYSIAAIGFNGSASMGLEYASKGFRVLNSRSETFGGSYPNLNELNKPYQFIAFR